MSENVIDSDNSTLDNIVEHHVFVSAAMQAQRYSDYFALMTSMCF